MEIQEILQQLERNRGRFPKAAVLEAVKRREEITPLLLQILEEVAADPAAYAKDVDKMIHVYAMYLLAQFRETRAYPLLTKIFAAPGQVTYDLVGDVVTEDFKRILASVSGGDTGGIKSLIENAEVEEYVRGAALRSLVVLVAAGMLTQEDLIAYLGHLFSTLKRTPNQLWNVVASTCSDICALEVKGALLEAYEADLVEPGFISWKNVQEGFAVGQEAAMDRVKQRYTLITDLVEDMGWWACFEKETKTRAPSAVASLGIVKTKHRESPKVGRNDPCPCGSGKKFKKCCGAG